MLLSVANAAPRNVEAVRTRDLLPAGIQANARTFVDLLEHYYDYLNSAGLPSREISSISTLKDVDLVSSRYLDQIEELIGKSIPNSKVLNRVELYKIIVRYYNTRGSEDSIHTFFKIFFDELVQIIYPKEHLFDLSGGKGAWSGMAVIEAAGGVFETRRLSDESTLTLGGITYDAVATDGGGQLVSVKYKAADADSYEVVIDYSNGVTTVTPGAKARIIVDADPLSDGFVTYPIATDLYFAGFVNGKPSYSERTDYVNTFVGSPTRIEWDGTQWEFTVGSSLGDVFAFYSEEDVDDPSLVTTWLHGWATLILPSISGAINDLTFGTAVNAQIFNALLETTGFATDVLISADIYDPLWTTAYAVTPRTYLTTNPLPLDSAVGSLAVVNGAAIRPYVFGHATIVDGDLTWQRFFTEEWAYENHRSFASDDYKLFDGYYWQDYSYVIKSDIDSLAWYDEYRKFVHPAGLKMFSAIAIEAILRNEWFEKLDYVADDIENDDTWMQAFIPPWRRNSALFGYHTPKFQPGYLRERILRLLFKWIMPDGYDEARLRLVLLSYKFTIGAVDVRTSLVRERYRTTEKFIDPCRISEGWLSKTIADADEEFSITNSCKIYNISSFIGAENYMDYSFYDPAEGAGDGVWDGSSYDTAGGTGDGVWGGSSYENL